MRSIIYSLYMWLWLCIILVVFRTGLKVNVMCIILQSCQKDVKCQKVKHMDYVGGSQKKIN